MNENDTFAFLQSLFGESDKGFLSVWAKGTDSRFFRANDLVAACDFIRKVSETIDVYVGVGIRQRDLGAKKRGGVSDVCRMSCVWLDLDFRDDVHATHKDLPRNLDEGFALIDHLPEPSMIVHSGHGLHIYWLLEIPIEISDAASLQEAQMLIRGVQEAVIDRGESKGLHVDITFDLARVLRPPGTFNYKSEPTAVLLLKADYQLKYKSDDLLPMSGDNDFGGLHEGSEAPNLNSVLTEIAALPSHVDRLIRKGMNGNSQYPTRSEAVAAVEHALIDAGRSDSEIEEILLNPAYAISELPREKGPQWIADDIKRAREKHDSSGSNRVESPRPMKFLSRSDLDDLKPPEWLMVDLIPRGGLIVVYGPSGCGKSFLALAWAASVATGTSWLEHAVVRGSILYVAAEGVFGIPRRLRAWEHAHLDEGDIASDIFVAPEPINLLETKSVDAFLMSLAKLSTQPILIVFDTLARCIVGGDENSAKDMGRAIAAVDRIRAVTGATVLLVHHTAKDRMIERGSSALRGAADSMFAMTENGPVLSTEKQKDAEPADDILLSLRPVTLTDGISSCVLEPSDTLPVSNLSAQQIDLIKVLFEQFSNTGARFTEWLAASDLNKSTFKRYRIALLAGKHVEETDKYYFVSDATCEALDCPDMKYRPEAALLDGDGGLQDLLEGQGSGMAHKGS